MEYWCGLKHPCKGDRYPETGKGFGSASSYVEKVDCHVREAIFGSWSC